MVILAGLTPAESCLRLEDIIVNDDVVEGIEDFQINISSVSPDIVAFSSMDVVDICIEDNDGKHDL